MKLKDYIKAHHNGTQSHFAAFHDIPESRVSELLSAKRVAHVFDHVDDDGKTVTSIFKQGRRLKGSNR